MLFYNSIIYCCRGGETRTPGLYVPNVARYQLRYTSKKIIARIYTKKDFIPEIYCWEINLFFCKEIKTKNNW